MDLKMDELDGYSYPKRRPWVVLIVVVALVAAVASWRMRSRTVRSTSDKVGIIEENQTEWVSSTIAPSVSADRLTVVGRSEIRQESPSESLSRDDARQLVKRAEDFEKDGQLIKARDVYWEVLHRCRDAGTAAEIKSRLGRIHVELLFTSRRMPEKKSYMVQPRDRIEKIARKFGTTQELIVKSNGIRNPDLIKAGDELRVFSGKLRIEISNP